MKVVKYLTTYFTQYQLQQASWQEKIVASLAAFAAIFVLIQLGHFASVGGTFSVLILASMGATAFLLFVIPHSPMSQPWPVVGGHFFSAAVGIACAHGIRDPALASAAAVALSILVMHTLQCLHPPSAATAMIAVLGGPEVQAMGWQFCYEVVVINAGIMVLLSMVINNLIKNRRYPMMHAHHPHHKDFATSNHLPFPELNEADFQWALSQMDAVIDVSSEDLVDLYEFAAEHAKNKKLSP